MKKQMTTRLLVVFVGSVPLDLLVSRMTTLMLTQLSSTHSMVTKNIKLAATACIIYFPTGQTNVAPKASHLPVAVNKTMLCLSRIGTLRVSDLIF